MKELIAVAADVAGRRYELTLRMGDEAAAALGQDEAGERLNKMLQMGVNRASEIMGVAVRDQVNEREGLVHGEPRGLMVDKSKFAVAKPGAAQVAFAGSDESVTLDKHGNESARFRGGKPSKGEK